MGLLTNMMLMYLFLGVYLLAAGIGTPFTAFITGNVGLITAIQITFSEAGVAAAAAIIASAILTGGAVIYVILAPVAVLLLTFITFPTDLFGAVGLPEELMGSSDVPGFLYFIINIMNLVFALAVVNWFKGGE